MSAASTSDSTEIRYFFIRRPVLAAVLSIVVTLLGLFALLRLPVNRYPLITPPAVSVSAVYPGATAEDVAQAVAAPIEQQLSGLDGLLYFKSSNSSDGALNLQVYFDINRDQDLAAVDVQNAVKLAEPQLPEAVRTNGIVVTKAQSDILFAMALYSNDSRYDASYLTNYAKLYLEDEIKRIPGVGNARVFGQLEFSMLLSLDPDRLAQLGLTVGDVATAVREQNTTNPAGRLGREPSPAGTQVTLPVTTEGRLSDPEQFANIILRARPDGSLVKVKDVGKVTLGARNYDQVARVDGKPTTFLLVYLRTGSNALDVRKLFEQRMNELSRTFPAGVSWVLPYDTTPFITESIREVVKTLAEAMLLVTLVVFVFLQSWRATLIPVLAVPVSVIGTFLGLLMLGFSVNVLTLFGLVLAIGIVVDDAIVVIENVERIMSDEKVSARIAADRAMRQVGGALVAIVLVLCAVFIPVAFLGGITGEMYKQFAVTIVLSVVISGMVALTLTPALCAVLLEHAATPDQSTNRFFCWFNDRFGKLTTRYASGVSRILGRPKATFAAFAVILALTFVLFRRTPQAFIPSEDKGFFAVAIQLPDGASKQRTEAVVSEVEKFLLADKGVRHVGALVGVDALSFSAQTNSGIIFVNLKPWEERTSADLSLDAIVGRTNMHLFGLKQTLAFAFNFPEIPGLGTTSGLEMNLQARGGQTFPQFAASVQNFIGDAQKLPELAGVQTTFRADVPQLFLKVDREAAKARGVALTDLFQTLQALLSTLYINDFNLYGKTYRVQAEAQAPFRQRPEDISRLYVRSSKGDMVPIGALTSTEFRGGPSIQSRFNGFTSALITGVPAPGRSSGEVLNAVEKLVADKYEAQGIGYGYSGQSFQERASSGQSGLVFTLGLVLVFLVLAAQYESWAIPFAVILGIPFGICGAFVGVFARGMASDVYFQVGLITVVGLAAKNAILIVEFATSLRDQGMSIVEAATEAARERFRPILMTSFAFILGVLPLAIANGAGAASRRSLGTGVLFGMLTATTVGIFFIPLFFATIRGLADRGLFRRRQHAVATPAVASPDAE
ncbi:MAG TPA: multidrug efflux RND transporter permease subunit [Gemmatimonadales bacterium]|nr:multidrug efflux RND transporter permease subunit [Gemmatimonadales bacterium]